MTTKRYLENAYIYEFDAKVIVVDTFNQKQAIVLDETYFYPEGGGQLSDIGQIGDYDIVDVQIKDGIIYHMTDTSNVMLQIDTKIKGSINAGRRMHLMKQHAGQHLFSGTAYNLFKVNTIGLHMGEDYVTVDFDQILDQAAINQIEYDTNKTIQENVKIIAHHPDGPTLDKMPLRKTPKVKENIRVIEISGYDFSPCGGIHPEMTGEIGLIKVKRFEKYKKGIRVEFVCGLIAVEYIQNCVIQTNQLMKMLAKPEFELMDGIMLLKQKAKDDKKTISDLEKTLISYEIESHLSDIDLSDQPCFITVDETDYPLHRMRDKINQMLTLDNLAMIFTNTLDDETYIFIGLSQNLKECVDLKKLVNSNRHLLNFKGGGNDTLIQGKTTEVDSVSVYIDALSEVINNALMSL